MDENRRAVTLLRPNSQGLRRVPFASCGEFETFLKNSDTRARARRMWESQANEESVDGSVEVPPVPRIGRGAAALCRDGDRTLAGGRPPDPSRRQRAHARPGAQQP